MAQPAGWDVVGRRSAGRLVPRDFAGRWSPEQMLCSGSVQQKTRTLQLMPRSLIENLMKNAGGVGTAIVTAIVTATATAIE